MFKEGSIRTEESGTSLKNEPYSSTEAISVFSPIALTKKKGDGREEDNL